MGARPKQHLALCCKLREPTHISAQRLLAQDKLEDRCRSALASSTVPPRHALVLGGRHERGLNGARKPLGVLLEKLWRKHHACQAPKHLHFRTAGGHARNAAQLADARDDDVKRGRIQVDRQIAAGRLKVAATRLHIVVHAQVAHAK